MRFVIISTTSPDDDRPRRRRVISTPLPFSALRNNFPVTASRRRRLNDGAPLIPGHLLPIRLLLLLLVVVIIQVSVQQHSSCLLHISSQTNDDDDEEAQGRNNWFVLSAAAASSSSFDRTDQVCESQRARGSGGRIRILKHTHTRWTFRSPQTKNGHFHFERS